MKIEIEISDLGIRDKIEKAVCDQYLNSPEKMKALVEDIEHQGWLVREVKDAIVRRITDAVVGQPEYVNDTHGLDKLIPKVIEKLDSDFLKEQIMARLIGKL